MCGNKPGGAILARSQGVVLKPRNIDQPGVQTPVSAPAGLTEYLHTLTPLSESHSDRPRADTPLPDKRRESTLSLTP